MRNDDDADWDPRSDSVLRDQCKVYDDMRRRCPVAYSPFLGWSLFRHQDVSRALLDHDTFRNAGSRHPSVPNGMDPPEHTAYRAVLEPCFSAERIRQFEPSCRTIARALLQAHAHGAERDWMLDFAIPFALRCQCAFLGWPESAIEPLRDWTQKNREATLAGDRVAGAEVAREFRAFVDNILQQRRRSDVTTPRDMTWSLMQLRVQDRPLTDEELTSILRNWTVGEVDSLSAAVGILVHRLAADTKLQSRLRREPSLLPLAIEEILRIEGPLVASRRVAAKDVEIAGRRIGAGQRVTLMWIAANRDERVFEQPEEVCLDRDQGDNLLYGAGIHVCPGASLARLELLVATEELLRTTTHFELGCGELARSAYPANGWVNLPLRLQ
jgi:cytochrome P450